jgi:hypothetical protein
MTGRGGQDRLPGIERTLRIGSPMPRLLLNLRMVPEDEASEVTELMDASNIEIYRTPPGPLGIAAGGIWLRHRDDYPRARALLDDYQAERAARARREHEQARREGRVDNIWTVFKRHPVRVLASLALAIFFLFVMFAPVVQLAR